MVLEPSEKMAESLTKHSLKAKISQIEFFTNRVLPNKLQKFFCYCLFSLTWILTVFLQILLLELIEIVLIFV